MKRNTIKRALAGVLAVLCVAGYLPANVGTGGLFDRTAIVASAATVDGVNFNENWSSTDSLPVPDHDDYTGFNTVGYATNPATSHNYSVANNMVLSGSCTLPALAYASRGTNLDQYGYYDLRYEPLKDKSSVRMYLNNHSIDANGNNMLSPAGSHQASLVYGFYGNGQSNEVISGGNSLGNNYGGTWILSGVTLDNFANIAELNSSHKFEYYYTINGAHHDLIYDNYPAILTMNNTVANCTNGVKLTNNGTLNLNSSTINAPNGDYAVDMNNGSFTVSGNSTINGVVQLNDSVISFASGAKLTGNIPIKWNGRSLNGSPFVFTSGAGSAVANGVFTSADGKYIEKSGNEWRILASAPNNLSGGLISGVDDTVYVVNGQSPTLTYTVKDAVGKNVTSYTAKIKNPSGSYVDKITTGGKHTLEISSSGYSGTVTKQFDVNLIDVTNTTINGYTFKKFNGQTNAYAITSADDWNTLADYSASNSTSGMTFRLTGNIPTVNKAVGSNNDYPFSGTFDGNGYTIDVSVSGWDYMAPFRKVKGATIQNLTVTGSISAKSGYGAGGIVGRVFEGSTKIKDCVVKASIGGDKYDIYGGFAGWLGSGDSSLTIEGCVFDGSFGDDYNKIGSFVGQITQSSASASVNNSFTSKNISNLYYKVGRATFNSSNIFNPTNSATVTCGDNVSLNLGSRTDNFGNNALVKVYNNAIQFDGKTYVKNGATVSFKVTPPSGYSVKSVKVNGSAVSVSNNAGSFTMPSGAVNVTAEFEKIPTYTVVWTNDDGTILETDRDVAKNTTPTYNGATPTKAADAQYTYTFSGWSPALSSVTDSITYTAQYTQTLNKYTVTWKNGEEILETDENVPYGTTPEYNGTEPAKTGDAQYSYTFTGWDKTVSPVTGDVTYTAQFSETVNEYTITWIDGDGNTLKTEQVAYGTVPEYTGDEPTKTATDQYSYAFIGWDTVPTAVTGNATYTAQFSEAVNKYTVIWKNGDDVLETDENVEYGATPSYDGAEPTKEADAQYTYTFDHWSPAVADVEGNVTYTAVFSSTVNEYTITWVDGDGNTLKTEQIAYGETPTYDGNTPTKSATAQYTYTFTDWDNEPSAVTGNATYTAQFSSTVNEYTIKFLNEDGTELQSSSIAYGETPVYNGAEPTKVDNTMYTYSFAGWTPSITEVTGATEYTATFSSIPKTYNVTYKVDGEVYGEVDTVAYGDTITVRDAPTQDGYIFSGWSEAPTTMPDHDIEIVGTFSVDENYGKLDVTEYKANGTYPTQEGKVFAGWYADETYTTPYMETTGYAYAKFIDEKVLNIRWQVPTDFADQDTTDIRLITTLDCPNYSEVHIKLRFAGSQNDLIDGKIAKVFSRLTGYVNGENQFYTPQELFSDESTYFAAFTVKGMPKALYGTDLTAVAYIVTQDGTIVYGNERTFKVSDDANYHN